MGVLLVGFLYFGGFVVRCGAATNDSTLVSFDVPAGDAESTLRVFAKQAAIQLLFDPEIVDGLKTNAVRGGLTIDAALRRLLAGTSLTGIRDELTGAFAIKKVSSGVTETKDRRVLQDAPSNSSGHSPLTTPAMSNTAISSNKPRGFLTRLVTGLAALALTQANAQTPAPKPATDETIVLSPFTVSSRGDDNRYHPAESASGGRVRVNIFDSTQTISVITRSLIDDVGTMRVLDSAKYISGVSENIIPNGLDFITIRGFTTRGQTLDGFTSDAQVNQDPLIMDRYEVVKGPNSVLSPAGVPGGTINQISKKPIFRDFGSVSAEVGRFDGNRGELDVNRAVGEHLALRLLASGQDAQTYADAKEQSWMVMPMMSYQFSKDTQLTIQAMARNARIQNYMGLPIDPTAGSTTASPDVIHGVDRFINIYGDNYRLEKRNEGRLFFTSNLSDTFSIRLAMRLTNQEGSFQQNQPSASWGAVDPRTGLFTPGIVYGPAPDFTPTPLGTPAPRVFNRGGRENPYRVNQLDIQNDYVHTYTNKNFTLTSLAGYAYAYLESRQTNYGQTKPPVDFDNPAPAVQNQPATVTAITNNQFSETARNQLYWNESLKALGGRLILNGGISYTRYLLNVTDYRLNASFLSKPSTTNPNYGILIKPIENVALYYNYSSASAALTAQTVAAGGPPLQEGTQKEYGARVALLNKKVTVSAVHFDVSQTNNAITDPRNTGFPPPNPLFPNLLSDRISKGWEFEFSGAITDEISVIGNYTSFTNRNAFNMPFSNVAERSWALFTRYEFKKDTSLSGLSVGVGVNHLARRPGDTPSGLAAGSTPTNPVPNQPSFYLPARTLVDLSVTYKYSKKWVVQLNVDNLLNEKYLVSSESRSSVWPGVPIDARLKITYKF